MIALSMAACVCAPGVFTEQSRAYSPDSTKFLLRYSYEQGAWDGDRSYLVTVLNAKDSINPRDISFSYMSYDFDRIYWKDNDTIIIEDSYTEYVSQGETPVKDTVLDGVVVKVIHRDPIDSTFTRKMLISRGLEKGREEGRQEGREEEKKKLYYTFVKNHLQHTTFSVPAIASLLGVSEAYVRKVKKELKK